MHRINPEDDAFERIAARQLKDERVKAQIIRDMKFKKRMNTITALALVFLVLQIIFTVFYS